LSPLNSYTTILGMGCFTNNLVVQMHDNWLDALAVVVIHKNAHLLMLNVIFHVVAHFPSVCGVFFIVMPLPTQMFSYISARKKALGSKLITGITE